MCPTRLQFGAGSWVRRRLRRSRAATISLSLPPLSRREPAGRSVRTCCATGGGADLINIDEAGIVDALREGRLGGAVLDVFETEPLPEAIPLPRLPIGILSRHMAGVSSAGGRPGERCVHRELPPLGRTAAQSRNIVHKRLGYVGSAPHVDTSKKGSIG